MATLSISSINTGPTSLLKFPSQGTYTTWNIANNSTSWNHRTPADLGKASPSVALGWAHKTFWDHIVIFENVGTSLSKNLQRWRSVFELQGHDAITNQVWCRVVLKHCSCITLKHVTYRINSKDCFHKKMSARCQRLIRNASKDWVMCSYLSSFQSSQRHTDWLKLSTH